MNAYIYETENELDTDSPTAVILNITILDISNGYVGVHGYDADGEPDSYVSLEVPKYLTVE